MCLVLVGRKALTQEALRIFARRSSNSCATAEDNNSASPVTTHRSARGACSQAKLAELCAIFCVGVDAAIKQDRLSRDDEGDRDMESVLKPEQKKRRRSSSKRSRRRYQRRPGEPPAACPAAPYFSPPSHHSSRHHRTASSTRRMKAILTRGQASFGKSGITDGALRETDGRSDTSFSDKQADDRWKSWLARSTPTATEAVGRGARGGDVVLGHGLRALPARVFQEAEPKMERAANQAARRAQDGQRRQVPRRRPERPQLQRGPGRVLEGARRSAVRECNPTTTRRRCRR